MIPTNCFSCKRKFQSDRVLSETTTCSPIKLMCECLIFYCEACARESVDTTKRYNGEIGVFCPKCHTISLTVNVSPIVQNKRSCVKDKKVTNQPLVDKRDISFVPNLIINKFINGGNEDLSGHCYVCLDIFPGIQSTLLSCSCHSLPCQFCARDLLKNKEKTFYDGMDCCQCKKSNMHLLNVREAAAYETRLVRDAIKRTGEDFADDLYVIDKRTLFPKLQRILFLLRGMDPKGRVGRNQSEFTMHQLRLQIAQLEFNNQEFARVDSRVLDINATIIPMTELHFYRDIFFESYLDRKIASHSNSSSSLSSSSSQAVALSSHLLCSSQDSIIIKEEGGSSATLDAVRPLNENAEFRPELGSTSNDGNSSTKTALTLDHIIVPGVGILCPFCPNISVQLCETKTDFKAHVKEEHTTLMGTICQLPRVLLEKLKLKQCDTCSKWFDKSESNTLCTPCSKRVQQVPKSSFGRDKSEYSGKNKFLLCTRNKVHSLVEEEEEEEIETLQRSLGPINHASDTDTVDSNITTLPQRTQSNNLQQSLSSPATSLSTSSTSISANQFYSSSSSSIIETEDIELLQAIQESLQTATTDAAKREEVLSETNKEIISVDYEIMEPNDNEILSSETNSPSAADTDIFMITDNQVENETTIAAQSVESDTNQKEVIIADVEVDEEVEAVIVNSDSQNRKLCLEESNILQKPQQLSSASSQSQQQRQLKPESLNAMINRTSRIPLRQKVMEFATQKAAANAVVTSTASRPSVQVHPKDLQSQSLVESSQPLKVHQELEYPTSIDDFNANNNSLHSSSSTFLSAPLKSVLKESSSYGVLTNRPVRGLIAAQLKAQATAQTTDNNTITTFNNNVTRKTVNINLKKNTTLVFTIVEEVEKGVSSPVEERENLINILQVCQEFTTFIKSRNVSSTKFLQLPELLNQIHITQNQIKRLSLEFKITTTTEPLLIVYIDIDSNVAEVTDFTVSHRTFSEYIKLANEWKLLKKSLNDFENEVMDDLMGTEKMRHINEKNRRKKVAENYDFFKNIPFKQQSKDYVIYLPVPQNTKLISDEQFERLHPGKLEFNVKVYHGWPQAAVPIIHNWIRPKNNDSINKNSSSSSRDLQSSSRQKSLENIATNQEDEYKFRFAMISISHVRCKLKSLRNVLDQQLGVEFPPASNITFKSMEGAFLQATRSFAYYNIASIQVICVAPAFMRPPAATEAPDTAIEKNREKFYKTHFKVKQWLADEEWTTGHARAARNNCIGHYSSIKLGKLRPKNKRKSAISSSEDEGSGDGNYEDEDGENSDKERGLEISLSQQQKQQQSQNLVNGNKSEPSMLRYATYEDNEDDNENDTGDDGGKDEDEDGEVNEGSNNINNYGNKSSITVTNTVTGQVIPIGIKIDKLLATNTKISSDITKTTVNNHNSNTPSASESSVLQNQPTQLQLSKPSKSSTMAFVPKLKRRKRGDSDEDDDDEEGAVVLSRPFKSIYSSIETATTTDCTLKYKPVSECDTTRSIQRDDSNSHSNSYGNNNSSKSNSNHNNRDSYSSSRGYSPTRSLNRTNSNTNNNHHHRSSNSPLTSQYTNSNAKRSQDSALPLHQQQQQSADHRRRSRSRSPTNSNNHNSRIGSKDRYTRDSRDERSQNDSKSYNKDDRDKYHKSDRNDRRDGSRDRDGSRIGKW